GKSRFVPKPLNVIGQHWGVTRARIEQLQKSGIARLQNMWIEEPSSRLRGQVAALPSPRKTKAKNLSPRGTTKTEILNAVERFTKEGQIATSIAVETLLGWKRGALKKFTEQSLSALGVVFVPKPTMRFQDSGVFNQRDFLAGFPDGF